ncbi:MFS transporter [Bordetella genomosp. 8]|uniref:MFS transporter n=1 Tax=Bordetella genomosp. 8 TaxID=1416806 RepID=A0A1W6YPV4_9BORD|nr:MFS transporter [Bordetella genomosp. 8]ARP82959.1 MFS transporter [Bordetella genomosp. 8]
MSSQAICAPRSAPWVLVATILASSMAFIDSTVVNVALPALQQSLGASFTDLQWVVQSYALMLASLLLVGGAAGDRFGRRRIFLVGVGLFALSSLWCAYAQGVPELVVARALQGAGGALLVPGSLSIINASFDDACRGRAIGVWSGSTSIMAALGPVLGGWLVQYFSWRAAFLINIPLAVAVIYLSVRHVPESRGDALHGRLDWVGSVFATLGLFCLIFGLTEASAMRWNNLNVLIALGLAGAFLAVFLTIEWRHPAPIMPLSLFSSITFIGTNIVTLFLYAALGGALFFLPLYLIQVEGYTTTAAGAALLPFIFLMFVVSPWSGGLYRRRGARLPLASGTLIAAFGFAMLGMSMASGSYWTRVFPAVVLLGLGMSIAVAPLTTAVMSSVPSTRSGVASAINNAASRVGTSLAIAVFGIVMSHLFNSMLETQIAQLHLSPGVATSILQQRSQLAAIVLPKGMSTADATAVRVAINEAFMVGYRSVMTLSALLALLASISAITLIQKRAADG